MSCQLCTFLRYYYCLEPRCEYKSNRDFSTIISLFLEIYSCFPSAEVKTSLIRFIWPNIASLRYTKLVWKQRTDFPTATVSRDNFHSALTSVGIGPCVCASSENCSIWKVFNGFYLKAQRAKCIRISWQGSSHFQKTKLG